MDNNFPVDKKPIFNVGDKVYRNSVDNKGIINKIKWQGYAFVYRFSRDGQWYADNQLNKSYE